jgi:hypothetical protein
MGRSKLPKNNKEYAIRLYHPEFGDFYYSHSNDTYTRSKKFCFVKNLKRVAKWKKKDVAEKNMEYILGKNYHILFLSFDKNSEIQHTDIEVYGKRKYYTINRLPLTEKNIETLKLKNEELEKSLSINFDLMSELFNKKIFNDDFFKRVNLFKKDTKTYKDNHEKLRSDEGVILDVVDASFNFRSLKLKKLQETEE